jgi:CTP:molybdopterin cytidylyltransferase MocA
VWKAFIIDEAWQGISKSVARAAHNLDHKAAIMCVDNNNNIVFTFGIPYDAL